MRGKIEFFFAFAVGVRKVVAFRNQAVNIDGSAQLHAPTTPQSTSDHVGAVGIDRGIMWWFCFYEGEIGVLGRFGGVG